jgi:uncharacterized membrane protein required for colicin V production
MVGAPRGALTGGRQYRMITHSPAAAAIDIVAMALILLGILNGLRRGLSGELSCFMCVMTASLVAIYFHDNWVPYIEQHVTGERQSAVAFSFIAMLGAAWVLAILLRLMLRRAAMITFDRKFDRVGGAISGLLSSTILIILVFLIMSVWPDRTVNRVFRDESLVGRAIATHLPMLNARFGSLLLSPSWPGHRGLSTKFDDEGPLDDAAGGGK